MMHTALKFDWEPLSTKRRNRDLSDLLCAWEGTPYMAGSQGMQMGVDCVRFVSAVLDTVLGKSTPIQALPQDVAFHNRARSVAAVRQLLREFGPHEEVSEGGVLRPCDVVVVGSPRGGPGHAILVGTEKNTLWQSDCDTGVCKGGFSLMMTYQKLYRVYRIKDLEERWRL